jgi:hypothetical protein
VVIAIVTCLVAWQSRRSSETIETIGEGQKMIHFAFSPDKGAVAHCRNAKTAEILDRRTGRANT